MIAMNSARRVISVAVALLVFSVGPALAQSTGMIKGKVVDAEGKPVEGARVVIEFAEGMNRKYETKTRRNGEFIQIGLQSGNYKVTADKEKLGVQAFDVRVQAGGTAEVQFQLNPATAGQRPLSKEEAAKLQAFKAAFDAGVTASGASNYDEAIAKFSEALTMQPDCYACQFNIGGAYSQKKDYAKAEEAFKAAMTMKPDSPEPYNALANIYNATKRFDDAAKMTEEATKLAGAGGADGGGSADQLFNQGVIFWNAGKIAEAKKQFEAALQLNASMADAHYWVGMANLNEGKLPEAATHFEEYIKLAPTGQYADQAKGVLSQIKK
jgi:tetratricopeptide (TPR) repeat protein